MFKGRISRRAGRGGVQPRLLVHVCGVVLFLLPIFAVFADRAVGQNLPPAGVVGLSPVEQITDSVLFNDVRDPTKQLYLPRFKLATQTVSGKNRYRVRLFEEGSGANLEVYLEKYPAPQIGDAARGAQELPFEAKVLLRYDLPANGASGQANVYKELAFQEVTSEKNDLKAVLHLNDLQDRDALVYALEINRLDARLLVRRTVTVRVRPEERIKALTKLRDQKWYGMVYAGRAGVYITPEERKKTEGEVAAIDEEIKVLRSQGTPETAVLDDSVPRRPFTFDRQLYPYVFAGIIPNPGNKPQLVRQQVAWRGRYYSYFRPADQPDHWYYLPDRFVLADGQGGIGLKALFSGGPENQTVQLEYVAVPEADSERLRAAEAALRTRPDNKITHEPLLVEDAQLWLALPGGDSGGPYQQRKGASVDLRDGVRDRLNLSLNEFQEVYEALFSSSLTLLTGEVRCAPDNTVHERIPLELRVSGVTPEALWNKVVSQTVLATYQKTVQVKTFSSVFTKGLNSLVVDFQEGEAVDLAPNRLEASAPVRLPVRDFVLNTENKGQYHYKVTAVRERDGKVQTTEKPSWKTAKATVLYPEVP